MDQSQIKMAVENDSTHQGPLINIGQAEVWPKHPMALNRRPADKIFRLPSSNSWGTFWENAKRESASKNNHNEASIFQETELQEKNQIME